MTPTLTRTIFYLFYDYIISVVESPFVTSFFGGIVQVHELLHLSEASLPLNLLTHDSGTSGCMQSDLSYRLGCLGMVSPRR